MTNLINVFTLLFVTMGPLKVTLVFADLTGELEQIKRRKIAVKAVAIAALIGLIFILAGRFLMELFHFSVAALMLGGGVILFVFAVNLVLGDGHQSVNNQAGGDASDIAVFPLAMPLMASPIGIVTLTTASAVNADRPQVLLGIAALLLVVMLINLTVLLLVERVLHVIPRQALQAAERILGILLAALAVETILNGLRALGVLAASGH